MLKYCKARNIKLLTYGTLAGGLLSDRYSQKKGLFGKYTRPDLNTSSLQMYWRIVKEAGGEEHWHQVLSILGEISGTRGVSIPAVALRWAMQQGPVHPIVGLRNSNHLHENLTALTFSLTPAEMEKIEAVLAQSPGPQGDCYEMERGN
jgi:aryl-alcohol dehydrogenase-like predicted oxidoreductase